MTISSPAPRREDLPAGEAGEGEGFVRTKRERTEEAALLAAMASRPRAGALRERAIRISSGLRGIWMPGKSLRPILESNGLPCSAALRFFWTSESEGPSRQGYISGKSRGCKAESRDGTGAVAILLMEHIQIREQKRE